LTLGRRAADRLAGLAIWRADEIINVIWTRLSYLYVRSLHAVAMDHNRCDERYRPLPPVRQLP
jgi:hypothetical protein